MKKSNILYIFVLWSLLIFVSYNVLTVEASEKEDKKVCESYGGEWKDIPSEGDDRGCQFENNKDAEAYSIRPGHSLDGTGSDAEYGRLDLDMSDDEAAAVEDDICDNEDADTTDIKLCMSEERLDQSAFKIDKDECEEANGEWKKDRCTYYEDEQQRQEDEVIEDWGNTVTDEEQQKYQEEQEYQQAKYEQLAHQYTEEEQKEMNDAIEEAASDSNESSEEEEQDEPEEESDDGGDESSEENNE